ncbi:MAG: hypothetical protein WCG50_09915 [Rhodoferax sp.]|uniref:hypothetical protein n=1 Tax=Rhodoferax sp. TaxID=50421 RepID=UPI00301A7333
MNRRHYPVSLLQASQNSPTLARLIELNADSVSMLKAIELLIPSALRTTLKAGPIEEAGWCLIVNNNAAAAKIRQLSPALEAHLRTKGWCVKSIRIKVQIPQKH